MLGLLVAAVAMWPTQISRAATTNALADRTSADYADRESEKPPGHPQRPLVGVIRWDGFNGSPMWTQQQEFGFLKPEKWHSRAPWFARRTGQTNSPLAFNPGYEKQPIQKVTDDEINYAAGAGIDYWAFCHYGRHKGGGWQMRDNFEAYLASPLKNRIKFAVIALGDHVGAGLETNSPAVTKEDWRLYVREYVGLMQDSACQRVTAARRPLFFLFNPEGLAKQLGDAPGKVENLREAIAHLREQARLAGLADPYIVGMNPGGIWAAVYVDKAGLDAVSAYRPAFGATAQGTPYAALWNAIRSGFIQSACGLADNPSRQIIVPLMSGADHTPRHKKQPQAFGPEHYREPLAGEFKAQVLASLDWAFTNRKNCGAQSVLIYAWNEHSEGGFICPTMGEPPAYKPNTQLLSELGEAIHQWKPPVKK